MLLVKTKLGESSKHGIGLFADQFVPKGTVTWEYSSLYDSSYTEDEVQKMSEPARQQFLHYAYFDKDINKNILCFDDQRFINHTSNGANILSTPHRDIAIRDIDVGEELLCDYNKFDDTYFTRQGIKEEELI